MQVLNESFLVVRATDSVASATEALWRGFRFYVIIEDENGRVMGLLAAVDLLGLATNLRAEGRDCETTTIQQLIYGTPTQNFYVIEAIDLRLRDFSWTREETPREIIVLEKRRPVGIYSRAQFRNVVTGS